MIAYQDNAQNWSDEEPFFTFEVPMYHVVLFEGVNVASIMNGMMGDLILPYKNISNPNHPMFKELQRQVNESPEPRKIIRIILPLRYTKVFEA